MARMGRARTRPRIPGRPSAACRLARSRALPYRGVFRLGSDGTVTVLTRAPAEPNGLAFSPDGKRLYADDTKRREIRVYDVTVNGELKNGRLFGKEEGRGGVPDGMRVDERGNVLVTGPGGIWLWDPRAITWARL